MLSAPAEVSAEFFTGVAPLTMKLAPGSAWKAAARAGSVTQSCAQASLPRKISTAPLLTNVGRSKRPPNSPRVSVAYYLRKPASTGAIGETKLKFNFGKGIKEASTFQQSGALVNLLTPDQVAQRSLYGNEFLPWPLEIPGRQSPLLEFETPRVD